MSSDKTPRYLGRILLASRRLLKFIEGLSLEIFLEDERTYFAAERQLQIISEPACRLGDQAPLVYPGPDWKAIRGIGNVLRHDYASILPDVIWQAASQRVLALYLAVQQTLRTHFPDFDPE